MDLSGAKRVTWWVALAIWIGVILGVLGILAHFVAIPVLSGYAFWLLAIGFVLLAVSAAIIYLRVLTKL